jgi:hypothetical protein
MQPHRTAGLLLLAVLAAAGQSSKPTFRLEIRVSSRDSDVKAAVTRYLSREVRALNDVVVTDAEPQMTLDLIVTPIVILTGERAGYAISGVLVFHESADTGMEGTARIGGHRLVFTKGTAMSDVEETCKREVANLDANILLPLRKAATGQAK